MLGHMLEAVQKRDEGRSWGMAEAQRASIQELLYAIYHVLHVGLLKPPHPSGDYEAWRPDHVKQQTGKPQVLSGREFLTRMMGKA